MTGAVGSKLRAWLTSSAAVVLAFAVAAWTNGGVARGQTLNPNPLLPSGVGSASDIDMSRGGGGGGGMGRSLKPGGRGLEENPADTLLREMNGTNNGRRTGRYTFDPRRRSTGYRRGGPKIEEGAVRFDQRGAYEEAIYRTRPGSYTYSKARRRGGR